MKVFKFLSLSWGTELKFNHASNLMILFIITILGYSVLFPNLLDAQEKIIKNKKLLKSDKVTYLGKYRLSESNSSVNGTEISSYTLTGLMVSPLSEGWPNITVTANDGMGGIVSTDFEVEVKSAVLETSLPWLGCLILDGDDDYAEAEDHPELDVGDEIGESITLEAWVNFSDFSSANIVQKEGAYTLYTDAYTSMGYDFRSLSFVVCSGGSNIYASVGHTIYGGGFWISGWHHVAGVYDRTTGKMSLYMDGEQSVSWDPGQNEINNTDHALLVGNDLDGQIEEIRISDNARYTDSTYTVPTSAFEADGHTRSLWHFDESEGSTECHDSGGYDNLLICYNGAYIFTSLDYSGFENPEDYKLCQNYPNPFNPSTVISWQLAVSSDVEVCVYNLLGQKVATLVSEKMPAGYHEVEFNGQNLSSGVYLYRIEAGEWQDVRKMVYIK